MNLSLTTTGGKTFLLSDETDLNPPYIRKPEGRFFVPPSGTFVQLRHDYQRAEFDFKPRNGHERPETIQFDTDRSIYFSPMSKEFQEFWFELIWAANGYTKTIDEMLIIWADVTANSKMLTDNHSRQDGFTDYILGENLGSSKGPICIKTLSCGGNVVEVEAGKYVKTLDPKNVPTDPKMFLSDVSLCHWANATGLVNADRQSNKLPDGTWKVVKFPNQKPHGIPFPFTSSVPTRYRTENIMPISNGALFSPYNPMPTI